MYNRSDPEIHLENGIALDANGPPGERVAIAAVTGCAAAATHVRGANTMIPSVTQLVRKECHLGDCTTACRLANYVGSAMRELNEQTQTEKVEDTD